MIVIGFSPDSTCIIQMPKPASVDWPIKETESLTNVYVFRVEDLEKVLQSLEENVGIFSA